MQREKLTTFLNNYLHIADIKDDRGRIIGGVESFRDLIVYKKARQLSLDVFEATKCFPREETFSLTD